MIRRLNYTRRKTIRKVDARISMHPDGDGLLSFAAELDLERYELPGNAPIFIEALRQTSFARFPFGEVGKVRVSPGKLPPEFGTGESVRFRVKIVEPASDDSSGQTSRLLAHAYGIQPRLPDQKKTRSLLPVESGDFCDEVWRLEIDESDQSGGPVLYISRHLVTDRDALVQSSEFTSLVLPQLLRSVLDQIVIRDEHDDIEDMKSWRSQWLRMAMSMSGTGETPDPSDKAQAEEWIGNTVAAFARRFKIARRFQGWWEK